MSEWQPPKDVPTAPGTRIRALVETELEMDEWSPASLSGGWRRIGRRDRIVGWLPLQPPPIVQAADAVTKRRA